MKRLSWVIAATLPLLGAPVLAGEKGEHQECRKVQMGDLPGVVQDALKQEASGGKVEELCKKGDKGAEIYKAEIVKDGKGRDVELNPDGKIVKHGKVHEESQETEHHGK
jgi:hypothetical protein